MLVIFPFCLNDAPLALLLAERIGWLGGCRDFEALVVASTNAAHHAPAISNFLALTFGKVSTFVLPATVEKGWPRSPNFVFKATVAHLRKMQNPTPFYFMEPDCTPMRGTWLKELAAEYSACGKPFMGSIGPTRNLLNGAEFIDGSHMVGTGIYPADPERWMTLLKYADAVAWDTFCQWEVVKHAHHTQLIQHNWGTINYRVENGVIVCEGKSDLGIPNNVYGEAAVVHGCKDGSLAMLLNRQDGFAVPEIAAAIPSSKPLVVTEAVVTHSALAAPTPPSAKRTRKKRFRTHRNNR